MGMKIIENVFFFNQKYVSFGSGITRSVKFESKKEENLWFLKGSGNPASICMYKIK
jgi:hypothetical protein